MAMTVMAIQFCKSQTLSLSLYLCAVHRKCTSHMGLCYTNGSLPTIQQCTFSDTSSSRTSCVAPMAWTMFYMPFSYKVALYVVSRKLRTRGNSLNGDSCQLSEGGLPESNESGGGVGGGSLVNGEYVLPLEP